MAEQDCQRLSSAGGESNTKKPAGLPIVKLLCSGKAISQI